jgi:LPS-assembly lipoprotein
MSRSAGKSRWLQALGTGLALLVLAPALSGCGFEPLYGESVMTGNLDDVQVVLAEHSREGFMTVEQLNEQLGRHATNGSWKLTLHVYSKRIPRGVRVNNVANRYELNLTVNYELSDAASGKVALANSLTASATYDSADQPYAGLAAERDGEERAARLAADQLRLVLAKYFAAHRNP